MKPRLLDLFSGAGGATRGYQDAGFYVVGVDINPQPNYCGDEFMQADALWFLENWIKDSFPPFGRPEVGDFDAIHASPPCQAYTELNNDKSEHPRLIAPTRDLLELTELPYVIENVPGARKELVAPVALAGHQFGLSVKRTRWFETNWNLEPPAFRLPPEQKFLVYEHGKWRWTANVPVYGTGGRKAVEYWPYAMGVGNTWDDCWMTREELAEAIPPAYTAYIGDRLLEHLAAEEAA